MSKELYRLLKEHEIGKRYTDELIKVYLKDGSEKWLLIHIEVQNYREDDFAKRMYIYLPTNPMAILVLAQLESLRVQDQANEQKYDTKLNLIRKLYKKGYNRKQISELFIFIDWLISIPEHLDEKITNEIMKLEEDEKVTYITSVERIGEKRGKEIGTKTEHKSI